MDDYKQTRMPLCCSKKTISIIRENNIKGIDYFCCLNCFHSFRTENKIEAHKDFCNTVMSSEDIKMLEFNRYQKSNKASFAFYADLEYLVEKIEVDKNALIL